MDYVKGKKQDFVVKNLETKKGVKIDFSKIEDLYDETGMLEEIDAKDLVLDQSSSDEEEKKGKGKKPYKKKLT